MLKSYNQQTDNSDLESKLHIRQIAIEKLLDNEICPSILECYSGNGVLYSELNKRMSIKLEVTRIDQKNDRQGMYLIGDNRKYLRSLSIEKYNIIDLDAYGIPYDQIKIILDRQWHGTLIVTHIQSMMGTLPAMLLQDFGITKSMRMACPTMYSKFGLLPIKSMLYDYGARSISGYFINRKSYFSVEI